MGIINWYLETEDERVKLGLNKRKNGRNYERQQAELKANRDRREQIRVRVGEIKLVLAEKAHSRFSSDQE